MKAFHRFGLLIFLITGLVVVAAPAIGSAAGVLSWQTGMRSVGNGATIEPAVNDVTGAQTFLITPNHSPFSNSTPIQPSFNVPSAPLYLVTYPIGSTADAAAPFNCYTEGAFDSTLPYNCDHAQIPGVKGHDHLVGVPGPRRRAATTTSSGMCSPPSSRRKACGTARATRGSSRSPS